MREKIEEILSRTNVAADEIDALLAAIGEGQEPVYQHRMYSGGWGDVDKAHHDIAPAHMRRTLYTAPQPAPDVAAMQARIAELERQNSEPFGYFKAEPFGWTDCSETDDGAKALYERPDPRVAALERQAGAAARQHNADVSALEVKLFQRTREKAELERVQGRLVAALESWNEVENYSAQYWSTPGADQEITDAWAAAVGKRRAALAEVKKSAYTHIPLNIPALLHQCAELAKWRYCMSYDDSYFGEPAGELKRITAEIDRLVPVGLNLGGGVLDNSEESNFGPPPTRRESSNE